MIKKIKTVFQFNVKQCVLPPRKRNFAVGECPMIFVEPCWQRENTISIYKVSLTGLMVTRMSWLSVHLD